MAPLILLLKKLIQISGTLSGVLFGCSLNYQDDNKDGLWFLTKVAFHSPQKDTNQGSIGECKSLVTATDEILIGILCCTQVMRFLPGILMEKIK